MAVASWSAESPRDTSSEGMPTRLPGAPGRDDRRPSPVRRPPRGGRGLATAHAHPGRSAAGHPPSRTLDRRRSKASCRTPSRALRAALPDVRRPRPRRRPSRRVRCRYGTGAGCQKPGHNRRWASSKKSMNPTIDTATPEALMATFAQSPQRRRPRRARRPLRRPRRVRAVTRRRRPRPRARSASRWKQLLALRPVLTSHVERGPGRDDIALVVNDWSMVGTAPDGTEVTQSGRSADVVRRQPDGRWLVVVDKP